MLTRWNRQTVQRLRPLYPLWILEGVGQLSDKLMKCESKHSMRVVRTKIEIIEAEIAKCYNDKRSKEEEKVIGEIKSDPTVFFNYAKKYIKTKESIGPIMDKNGNIHWNCKNIADLLKDQYRSVFSKPREHYNYQNIDYKCGEMEKSYFTRDDILKQIRKLNNNSSLGPDGVI